MHILRDHWREARSFTGGGTLRSKTGHGGGCGPVRTTSRGLRRWPNSGEVPVFGMLKDLVVESGIDFGDRGEHQLKGVPGSWKLFAVET